MLSEQEKKYIKPLIKWVGGKTQMIDTLYNYFPKSVHNFHDVFLGGGSVLLMVLQEIQDHNIEIQGQVYAYDYNETLIHMFKNVQKNPEKLYNEIITLKNIYDSCDGDIINRKPNNLKEAKESKENYYYWIRSKYNVMKQTEKNTIIGSATFIFLNKTCFRGLYREGPNGFNVPFGHYKNPSIIDKQHLMQVHNLIQHVEFKCCDFEETFKQIESNDFAYLDPPYAPLDSTTFVKYVKSGFTKEKHETLFKLCNLMNDSDKKYLLNNHNVELVRKNFVTPSLKKVIIESKRRVNSKNPESVINELMILNY